MMKVNYCAPFNGRLALSGVIAYWLLPRLLKSPLMGREIDEQDLYDFIVETEPRHRDWFAMAGIDVGPVTPPAAGDGAW